jgi:hypothetical protein
VNDAVFKLNNSPFWAELLSFHMDGHREIKILDSASFHRISALSSNLLLAQAGVLGSQLTVDILTTFAFTTQFVLITVPH